MKWLGQHIWDFVSRFRSDVYLEAVSTSTETDMLVVDSGGKITKRAIDAITVDVSDFMTNGADNRILTATGTDAILAETYATFVNTGNVSTLSLLSNQDTGDLFSIATTTHGATTFTTVDDDTTAADLTFTVDGKITMTPADINGRVFYLDADADSDNEVQIDAGILDINVTGVTTLDTTELTVTGKTITPIRKYELPSSTVGDYKGGDIYYYGDGSTVKGGIYYINGTNWTLADADAEASTSGLLAVALGTDPDADGMLLRGFCTLLTEVEGTEAIGSPIYLSATNSGKATITVPGSGDFVRVLGYSLHATDNQVYFNPDNTWVEVA